MSYIKLQDAKNVIMNCITEQTVSKYATSAECRAARHGADIALFALDSIPTADVVEVVRCKDCSNKGAAFCMIGDGLITRENENCYCSYGERREE